jgi:hypothetical protein
VTGTNNNKTDDNDDKRNLEVTIFHDDASSIPRDAMRLEARGDRRGFVVVVDVAEEDMALQAVLPPTTGLVEDLVVETIGGGTRLMNPDANDRDDAHHTAMTRRRDGKEAEETFMMLVPKDEFFTSINVATVLVVIGMECGPKDLCDVRVTYVESRENHSRRRNVDYYYVRYRIVSVADSHFMPTLPSSSCTE